MIAVENQLRSVRCILLAALDAMSNTVKPSRMQRGRRRRI
jgi:hypothetical protein